MSSHLETYCSPAIERDVDVLSPSYSIAGPVRTQNVRAER